MAQCVNHHRKTSQLYTTSAEEMKETVQRLQKPSETTPKHTKTDCPQQNKTNDWFPNLNLTESLTQFRFTFLSLLWGHCLGLPKLAFHNGPALRFSDSEVPLKKMALHIQGSTSTAWWLSTYMIILGVHKKDCTNAKASQNVWPLQTASIKTYSL